MSLSPVILEEIEKLPPLDREQLAVTLSEKYLPPANKHLNGYDSIISTPDVCGGSARLVRTRIPVWTLVRLQQLGTSEADLLKSYPTLRASDLVQAWSYANQHRDEIAREILENEDDS